ncbi:MAG: altronate dehydratase family protein [Bacilli bacterium]|nr:altronate dehydratase family protein [Bacilli bacterium]
MKKIVINPIDNVEILLEPSADVPAGHKIARGEIKKGEYVYKYGQIIGRATSDIKKGEWVHTHNVKSHLDEDPTYTYSFKEERPIKRNDTWMGYVREDGSVGARNDIYIIPTVGCVNNVAKELEEACRSLPKGSIDSIVALTHQFGCSQLGNDLENIAHLLSSIALNPNATYVLFVGLGCENNRISEVRKFLDPLDRKNVFYMNCQEHDDEIEEGMRILKPLIAKASKLVRTEVPFSKLNIGVKCGGSDGFSGLTANPLVGKMSDRLVENGGISVFTEVPEMFGAEQLLMNRCESKDVYERFVKLIVNFKKHYTDLGFPVYENPSPGNKDGGITTLEEKSLGCIEKSGKYPLVDVLGYGEVAKKPGINVLDAPGNDLIAATALGASGCQIVLFTTGRGTPFATFVPTLKIATNASLAKRKANWIDFDASTIDEEGLFNLIKKAVSGEYRCKSEFSHEIAFYKKGVTL